MIYTAYSCCLCEIISTWTSFGSETETDADRVMPLSERWSVRILAQPLVSLYQAHQPKGNQVQSLVDCVETSFNRSLCRITNSLTALPLPRTADSKQYIFTTNSSRLVNHPFPSPERSCAHHRQELCQFKLDRPVPINPPALEVHHTTQCLAK